MLLRFMILFLFLPFIILKAGPYAPSSTSPQGVELASGRYLEADATLKIEGALPFEFIREFGGEGMQMGGWGWRPSLAMVKDPREKKEGLHLKFGENRLDVVNAAEDKIFNSIRWHQSPDGTQGDIFTNDGNHFNIRMNPQGLIEKLVRNRTSSIKYQYMKHPVSGIPLISRRENEHGTYLINEYYLIGENQVGEQSLPITTSDDFRIGKVRQQRAPAGENGADTIIARYFYGQQRAIYLDALGQAVIYNFEGELITSIDYAAGTNHTIVDADSFSPSLLKRERYFWDEHKRLVSHITEDENEDIIYCETFGYDDNYHLVQKTIWGNLSGEKTIPLVVDRKGIPLNNGIENYSVYYNYDAATNLLLEEKEDDGKRILYTYDERGLLVNKRTFHQEQALLRHFFQYDQDGVLMMLGFDDGSGEDPQDLQGVSERHITTITLDNGHLLRGLPKMMEEKHLDVNTGEYITTKTSINTYDPRGHIIQKETCDAEGSCRKALEAGYDKDGRVIYHKGEGEKETLFSYGKGVINAIDLSTSTEIVSVLDSMGRSTRKIFTDSTGTSKMTVENYDAAGRKIAAYDVAHNATLYTYDSLGRIITMEQPAIEGADGSKINPKTSYEYDVLGRLISTTDPLGWKTSIRYSTHGKPIEIHHPDGTKETFTYTLNGHLATSTAKNGMKIYYRYDPLGRVVETSHASKEGDSLSTKTQTYNALHHLSEIDPNGIATYFSYDPAGRLHAIERETDEGPAKEEYVYDAMDQVLENHLWHGFSEQEKSVIRVERDHQQQWISTSIYDAEGSLVRLKKPEEAVEKKSSPNGEISSQATDIFDQRVTEANYVDDRGNKTVITYNALMKIAAIQVISPQGHMLTKTAYHYDAAGNKIRETKITYNQTEQTDWEYGPANRIEKITTSSSQGSRRTTHFTYNTYGQLEKIIKSDGVALIHAYDGKGRLSSFYSSDHTISYLYHYDAKDQIIKVEDLNEGITTLRSYTSLGNIAEETLGNGLTLKNSYDLRGRRTKIELHDGSSIHYTYDAADIKSIARYSSQGIQKYIHHYIDFDLSGHPVNEKLIGDLGTITTTYDAFHRILSIDTPYWSEMIPEDGFDEQGNIQTIMTNDLQGAQTTSYSYDFLSQLTEEHGETTRKYQYDTLRNRLSKDGISEKVNAYHQVISSGKTTYTYDANGSLLEEHRPDVSKYYSYDALGRLLSVKEDTCITTYTYDSFYRRLTKTQTRWDEETSAWSSPVTRRYLFDGDREIGAVDEEGEIVELRVLGEKHGAEIGAAIALEIDGKTYAPIHDHRGSIRCLIDIETHQIAETYVYSAFGEENIIDGEGENIDPLYCISPWRYNSKRYDPETGWIYFGKRYYDPKIARWTTSDVLGTFDGPNPYAFLKNNPLIHNDLYGLFSISSFFQPLIRELNWGYRTLEDFRSTYLAPWFDANYSGELENAMGAGVQALVGQSLYWLSGFSNYQPSIGVYGTGEVDERIRITFINGILSRQDCYEENVRAISESHNNNNVHYIYRGTFGWTHDVMQAVAVRLGYISNEAKQLSMLWKSMITEMGGLQEGGLIIHYAHSLGAAETLAAKYLLTKEEAKMIRVITFGSPIIFYDEDFESLVHYVSIRDGVSILFDPVRFIQAMVFEKHHVVFIGNWQGIPLMEHLLNDYWDHLRDILHDQFIDLLAG